MSTRIRRPDAVQDRVDVSVVIPTCNRWELLSTAALRAALLQEAVNHEIVVVDDGSIDETPSRLSELAVSEPRLRIVRNERSLGVAAARNAGIRAARGQWIAFLDDDDLWSPRKLRAQIDVVVSEQADFVYGGAAWLDERHTFRSVPASPDPADLATRLLQWNIIWAGGSNVVARTDVVRRLHGFDERLFQLADWDLWIRLALEGNGALCPEIVVGYVMQPESMLLTDRRDVFDEFEYLVAKHREASAAHRVEFDRARFSRWVALGHLRAGRRGDAARTYLRGAVRHRDAGAALRAFGAIFGPASIPVGRALLFRVSSARRRDAVLPDEPSWLDLYR
jgi:glycosyltransferase involved in cell wall biosynthesis